MKSKKPPPTHVGIIVPHPRRKDGWAFTHQERVSSGQMDFLEENGLDGDLDATHEVWVRRRMDKRHKPRGVTIDMTHAHGEAFKFLTMLKAMVKAMGEKVVESVDFMESVMLLAQNHGAAYDEVEEERGKIITQYVWKDGSRISVFVWGVVGSPQSVK